MKEVAQLINVKLTNDQTSTSHRLPSKSNRTVNGGKTSSQTPPPIIVRFVSRDKRNEMMANRHGIRQADLKKFSVAGTNGIYINENLTHYRKKLFWLAKQKAKSCEYEFFWTVNCNIFVKETENSKAMMIKNEQDLQLIK